MSNIFNSLSVQAAKTFFVDTHPKSTISGVGAFAAFLGRKKLASAVREGFYRTGFADRPIVLPKLSTWEKHWGKIMSGSVFGTGLLAASVRMLYKAHSMTKAATGEGSLHPSHWLEAIREDWKSVKSWFSSEKPNVTTSPSPATPAKTQREIELEEELAIAKKPHTERVEELEKIYEPLKKAEDDADRLHRESVAELDKLNQSRDIDIKKAEALNKIVQKWLKANKTTLTRLKASSTKITNIKATMTTLEQEFKTQGGIGNISEFDLAQAKTAVTNAIAVQDKKVKDAKTALDKATAAAKPKKEAWETLRDNPQILSQETEITRIKTEIQQRLKTAKQANTDAEKAYKDCPATPADKKKELFNNWNQTYGALENLKTLAAKV
jgi:hypothetical protein